MLKTKKSMRFLTVFALIFAMVFSIMTVPVSAAGIETWYGPTKAEDTFPIHGYNLTPEKTMGVSGELVIVASFTTTSSEAFLGQIRYTVEICNVLGSVVYASESQVPIGFGVVSARLKVTQGQKYAIRFKAYNLHGEEIDADVWYTHAIN